LSTTTRMRTFPFERSITDQRLGECIFVVLGSSLNV
jgi:hypothetical protein